MKRNSGRMEDTLNDAATFNGVVVSRPLLLRPSRSLFFLLLRFSSPALHCLQYDSIAVVRVFCFFFF